MAEINLILKEYALFLGKIEYKNNNESLPEGHR